MTDMGSGGVLNSFFLQISDLSYGIFIWMLACILFWAVDKNAGAFSYSWVNCLMTFLELILLTGGLSALLFQTGGFRHKKG